MVNVQDVKGEEGKRLTWIRAVRECWGKSDPCVFVLDDVVTCGDVGRTGGLAIKRDGLEVIEGTKSIECELRGSTNSKWNKENNNVVVVNEGSGCGMLVSLWRKAVLEDQDEADAVQEIERMEKHMKVYLGNVERVYDVLWMALDELRVRGESGDKPVLYVP